MPVIPEFCFWESGESGHWAASILSRAFDNYRAVTPKRVLGSTTWQFDHLMPIRTPRQLETKIMTVKGKRT